MLLVLLLCGCSREFVLDPVVDDVIMPGDKVAFTTLVPDDISTKTAKDDWTEEVNKYVPIESGYNFTVEMWTEDADHAISSGEYEPVGEDGTMSFVGSGDPLVWEDNVTRFGFKAEANNNALVSDQSDEDKWLAMDYLRGYSYVPLWTGDESTGSGTNPNEIMYLSSKEWYSANKESSALTGLMVNSNEDYKKVPLYMKHQRAWITVILKAGEGVSREALSFDTSETNIATTIYSYEPGNNLAVDHAWAREYLISYEKDKNGPAASNVSTVRYDAIVAPHDYYSRMNEDVIARISLSNQNFSFYASNDDRLLGAADADAIAEARDAYNLTAGKHLTIEATLSRESRKILITAWVEDWTEKAISTICDDYGKAGDPVQISTKDDLIAFLNGAKNKAGNVGIMNVSSLNLDAGGLWPAGYNLNATLNLAGCEITTSRPLFSTMTSGANLVNGTIVVKDDSNVPYAIAGTNEGLIERVDVKPVDDGNGYATVAGLVGINSGTIYQCTSTLPVLGPGLLVGEEYYVGGIAAKSVSPSQSSTAVVDACTVNASVNGSADGVYGGGIVGYATGRISNNTYEYGISISQPSANYKNIFALAGNDQLQAFNNAWPTKAKNTITEALVDTNPNAYSGAVYDIIIGSQDELDAVMNNNLQNDFGVDVRISKDFVIYSETWDHGVVSADKNTSDFYKDNVLFNLDGNGKTITLTGARDVVVTDGEKSTEGNPTHYTSASMMFNYVLGSVKDLTIFLDEPLVAQPGVGEEDIYNASDAVAPLAYAVYGANDPEKKKGILENVDVKSADGAYVQAATPAGLVVWAFGGASITNCNAKVEVKMWLPSNMGVDAKHYAGGLVACAAKANISQCHNYVRSSSSVSAVSAAALASSNVFLGGIVGGTVEKSTNSTSAEYPLLKINDCSSWFDARRTITAQDKTSKGAIIAYTAYADENSVIVNGMADSGNEGNWWPETAIGAHTWATGLTEEDVIGKRNAVEPPYNTQY